jgi:hypothetical protein
MPVALLNSEGCTMFTQINDSVRKCYIETARCCLPSVSPKTQKAVLVWLHQAEGIKHDPDQCPSDKIQRLEGLEISPNVIDFLTTVVNQLVEEQNRYPSQIVSTRLATPTFILTEGFDDLAAFIREVLNSDWGNISSEVDDEA